MRISDWSSDVCSSDLSATRSDPASMIGGSKDGLLPGGNRDAWRATPNDDMAERGAGRRGLREPDPLRLRRCGARGHAPRRPGGKRRALLWRHHGPDAGKGRQGFRSEEHTSELQSLMRISYAVFRLKHKIRITKTK